MAQNRKANNEPQHASESEEESSSEENEEQEGSESESESEEEAEPAKALPPTPPATKKPPAPKTSLASAAPNESSSSEESGSDSESGSPPEGPSKADPNVKPIASKPMDEPKNPMKKPRSKPSVPTSPTSAKPVKRPAESDSKDSRKAKRKASDVNDGEVEKKTTAEETKKQLFQRTFSEDDEIAILNGVIEYTAKKGADPAADMNAFHNFIKKSLHVDVSKTQLSDKVRRLKKKYETNVEKEKKGQERNLKSHEQQAYELSKKIWGCEGNDVAIVNPPKADGTPRKSQSQRARKPTGSMQVNGISIKMNELSSPNLKKEVTNMEAEQNLALERSVQIRQGIGDSRLEEFVIKDGLELIKGPRRAELEGKWKQLLVEEVELYLKRVDLIREQATIVLEELKSAH